jgi:hypothetical protein
MLCLQQISKIVKTSICLTTKRQTLENFAIDPTNLSLSAVAFSNGDIQPHETGCESLQ